MTTLLRRARPRSGTTSAPRAHTDPPAELPRPAPPSRSSGPEEILNEPPLTTPARPRPTLATLPPEIHLLIAQHLIYPDALSLKHTSRHFYRLVDTGVRLKVAWLMERRLLHLECPSDRRCDLGSDLRFCRGSVRLLMRRRREHIECESRPGLGCLIYGTSTCPHARKLKTRVKKWLRGADAGSGGDMRWMLLLASLVPLFIGWVWMVGVIVF